MKRILSLFLIFALLAPAAMAEQAAQRVPVQLYGNPSTGYVWMAESSDEAVASAAEEGFVSDDESLMGAPGMTQLTIVGKSEGTASISFTYARPWDSMQPVVRFTVGAIVTDNGDAVLAPWLTLPELPGSGYVWRFAQGDAQTVRIAMDEDGTATLMGLADGNDSVILGYLSPSGTSLLWAFMLKACVQDGVAAITSLEFLQELSIDPFGPEIVFSTTDLDGNAVTSDIFAEHALTILNFWEPWCGPCVGEMPDLEKLDKAYDDVQVIGIFSTPDSEDEVRDILESTGVTYPILNYVHTFDALQTGYVPTTVIVNNEGRIVYGPSSGAMKYAAWASLVESLR